MRDKREVPSREPNRRGPKAVQDYDERMPRRTSKGTGPPNDRDRDSPLPKHRSMAVRPHERERDLDSISYYQGRSGGASKIMSSEEAQKAIRTLFVQVKETISFFTKFSEDYQREIRAIRAYADPEILDRLWKCKIKDKYSKTHSGKRDANKDGGGSRSGFHEVSKRLWDSLEDAYLGARSHPSDQNDGMARKLENAKNDVGNELTGVRTECQKVDALIRELKLLKVVLELGGAGIASHVDRADQRPRTHAAGHGILTDDSPELEDERYGGMGEHSGSEDNGECDEQRGEHSERYGEMEEREVGGDGGGQGPFPTYRYL